MQKHKFASISLTVRDRAISSKFSTHRVSQQTTLCNFPKIFIPLKMTAILNFRIFSPKMQKHKFASISLTVRDRAISSKLSTNRVSQNFQIFAKNAKTQICFYLLNRARYSNFIKVFNPQGISAIYTCQFCPSFRIKLMLPFGWTLRMSMRPISSSEYSGASVGRNLRRE